MPKFPCLDNETEVSGKLAVPQPEHCMLPADDVEQADSDQIIPPEWLSCGDDSAVDDCILEEELDSFPKLGFLNVLEEEEEEDVDEDDEAEDYEAEFWFEKSVNENDEERFTLKTVGDDEDHNASDKDCSSPVGEQVEGDCSDSEKDYSRPSYGQAQNDDNINLDEDFIKLFEQAEDDQDISDKEFANLLEQAQDNQVISDREFASLLQQAQDNQVISSKECDILLEKHEQDHNDSDEKSTCNIGGHVADSDKDLSILFGPLNCILHDGIDLEVPIQSVEDKCCTFSENLEPHTNEHGFAIPIDEAKEDVESIDDSCKESTGHPDRKIALDGQEDYSDCKHSQEKDVRATCVASITRNPQKCHLDIDVEKGNICLCTYFREKYEAISDKLASQAQTHSSEQSLGKAKMIKFDTVQGRLFSDKLKHFQINENDLASIEQDISLGGQVCGGMNECNFKENITKENSLMKYVSVNRSCPISQRCFCCENDFKRTGDEQSLVLEKLLGDQIFDNETDREFFDERLFEDTESYNFALGSGGLVYGYLHNDSGLPPGTDIEKDFLKPAFQCSSLNHAEIEQRSQRCDNQAGGLYESMENNRKMEGSRSAWFTGIDNPAFFSDELAEETNDKIANERIVQSSKLSNRLCCLDSSLPTVVIEDCVSDGIIFVEDIEEKEVSYKVYEEIDSHISNLTNRSGLNVAGNRAENVLAGLAQNAPMDVNGDMSEDASVDLSTEFSKLKEVADVVLIRINDTNICSKAASDSEPVSDNFQTTPTPLKVHVQRDQKSLPCDKPVTNNILRSSSSIIRAFEKEVHLIYSKYKDTNQELPTAVKTNPPGGKVQVLSNAQDVFNNSIHVDVGLKTKDHKDALNLEMERKPIKAANLQEDALDLCKQPERQKDTNCKKNIKISFRIIGDNSKDAIVANVCCCGKFFIDEIKTSEEEWHVNDGPSKVQAVNANSSGHEDTGMCHGHVSLGIVGLAYEREKNPEVSHGQISQEIVGALRNEEDNIELSQNRGTAQDDSITEFCGGCSQTSMVFNDNKDTSELNAEQELQHFADIARSDSEYIVSLQESFEKNAKAGEYLESSVAVLSPDYVAGGEAQGLACLETSTPMESMEVSLISENQNLPPTSALPDHLSSAAKPETRESPAVSSKSVTKTVCLRLEPGQELDKVIKPSDVAVTSCFVVDDVSDTVVCSSSFYSDSIQATVTSTLNLGIPSLEVDIALQKQNPFDMDGGLELGEILPDATESSIICPQSNWLVPVVNDGQELGNTNQGPSTFFQHIACSDIVTCIFNFVDVLFWICLAVAIIIFDFRNWSV